jgi:hypothetical protein
MPKYRKLLILAALLIATAAIAFVFYRNALQPPESARLLPEGDMLIYANFKPIHLLDLNKPGPVQLEGDYQDFVAQTGIQFERDLDEVAMSRRDTPNGLDVESSEIFAGRFHEARLKAYLQKIADSTEQYRSHTIYSIFHQGHNVRVSVLGNGKVAVTNMVPPEPMHGIIDRTYTFSKGPALLVAHYHDVPLTSLGWLIYRFPNKPDAMRLPGGLGFSLPPDAVAVTSLRYSGSLLFRADVFAQSEAQAAQIVDSANQNLALVRSVGQWVKARGPDQDIKAAFDSIRVEQKQNVAVFTATIPQSILKKIWSEAAGTAAPR